MQPFNIKTVKFDFDQTNSIPPNNHSISLSSPTHCYHLCASYLLHILLVYFTNIHKFNSMKILIYRFCHAQADPIMNNYSNELNLSLSVYWFGSFCSRFLFNKKNKCSIFYFNREDIFFQRKILLAIQWFGNASSACKTRTVSCTMDGMSTWNNHLFKWSVRWRWTACRAKRTVD